MSDTACEPTPQRKRASRYRRSPAPPAMRLTDRDKEVVRAVNDFRVMRQDQVQRLFFPSRNTAQVRLGRLWQHGFLEREFLPVRGGIQTSPVLYVLGRAGAHLLQREFGYARDRLRWSPRKRLSFQFIEHTLGLGDIRVAVELSCRDLGYQMKKWHDENVLKEDYDRVRVRKRTLPVLPDAYFVIGLPQGELHFFVEYDRGLERLTVFRQKVVAYLGYLGSSQCEARYGTSKIRVLTVVDTAPQGAGKNRLQHLRQAAGEVGVGRYFWFCPLADLMQGDALAGKIWQVAGLPEPAALVASGQDE